jgi:glycosyltransferase involved in cell wall biosynthesis
MPTLLQIVVEGNTGSTGTIAESIGELVMENGWESFIAHGRFPRPSKSKIIHIGSDIDVLLHGIETRLFDRHGLGSSKATKKLIRQIKKIRPDIIHLHHLHGYYINIKILFEYLSTANIPVIWTFHDCWSFTGHCCHFDHVGCEKWKSECNKCPQFKEYPASLFFDRSKQNFHLKKKMFTSVPKMIIVSVSKWLGNIVSESFFKNVDYKVIYNGVDIKIFKKSFNQVYIKAKYGVGNSFMILGVASPWGKRKGFEDFINLSNFLKEDEKIVLVGLSDKQLKMLPNNIIGLSKTENKLQLVDLYSAADVYINLSVEETFGLTTAEALSCGTPAIVYNTTACPEVISSDTGIVVEKKDMQGLVKAISTIRSNGKKFYSKKCRIRAKNKFNKTEMLKEYFALYKQQVNLCG